ncbi:hypothetical protein P7L78_09100 [Tistrella bauzanensis]|uniref:hypothetical protein n=1 Tax=Tistrella TaxID=171436 RepID=UPI0031F7106F
MADYNAAYEAWVETLVVESTAKVKMLKARRVAARADAAWDKACKIEQAARERMIAARESTNAG